MAIQVLPSGYEPILQGLAALGQGAIGGITADETRRRAIQEAFIQDPSRLAAIGAMADSAEFQRGEKGVSGLSDALGISSLGLDLTSLLEPTVEQQQNREGVERKVGAARVGAELDAIDTQEDVNTATRAQAGAAVSESNFRQGYYQEAVAQGLDVKQVEREIQEHNSVMDTLDLQDQERDVYRAFIQDLPPQLRSMAASYMTNPAFADYLARAEEMEFQMRLARLQQTPDPAEQVALMWQMYMEANDQLLSLNEALQEDPRNEALGTAFSDLGRQLQGLQQMGFRLPNLSAPIAEINNRFFGRDSYEPSALIPQTPREAALQETMAEIALGNLSPEQVFADPSFQQMNATDRAWFTQQLLLQMERRNQEERQVSDAEARRRSKIEKGRQRAQANRASGLGNRLRRSGG